MYFEEGDGVEESILLSKDGHSISAHCCFLSAFSSLIWRSNGGPDGAGGTQW